MRELSSPTPPQPRTPDEPEPTGALFEERIALDAGGLRRRTARGSIVNAAYFVGLYSLGLLKGFVVAAFLTTAEYGVWGILVITVATLLWLRQIGISDKYIQQSEVDQELAFQRAFTLQLLLAGAFGILLTALLPLFAVVYGRPELVLPGLVLALATVAGAFTSPVWIFYRRMQFVRQRTLQAIDPVASFVITVALAIAGAGYWSLVIGTAVGTAAAAIASVWASPYPLRIRYDRGTLRRYAGFSWPLFVAGGSAIVIAQGSILLGEWQLGLAGVGAITLAAVIAQYTDRVDTIITGTLYPAICAVRDRSDLLFESFVKSNRLALMWGMPFGFGLTLFASDLVAFGIGEQWQSAVVLLQVFGANAAVNHIGFNWTAFYRAIGDTRPIAVVSFVTMLAFLAAPAPLLFTYGLDGFALGMAIMTAVTLAARGYYLGKLFSTFAIARQAARAIAPTIPAVAAILAVRMLEDFERTLPVAIGELALYLVITGIATLGFERALLGEVMGYLRRPSPAPARAAS